MSLIEDTASRKAGDVAGHSGLFYPIYQLGNNLLYELDLTFLITINL